MQGYKSTKESLILYATSWQHKTNQKPALTRENLKLEIKNK